jgi:hypothetical protein
MTYEFKNISSERFDNAAAFFMQILGIREQVAVEFIAKNLRRGSKESRAWGWCSQIDRFHYDIEIDANLSARNVLTVLAHELTHVQQYFTGRLRDAQGNERASRWYGKPCGLDYDLQPWEIEARMMEAILYRAFIEWEAK